MESVILLAIPFFLLAMVIEYWVGRRKKQQYYALNDTLTNLSIGIGNQAIGVFITLLLVGAYVWIYQNLSFFSDWLQPSWWAALLCLLGFDFLYYWAHRWSHEWNFLWAAHVVHHQSEEYNLSVALRQSWFHNLLAFFIFLPLPLLGFEPNMFFGVAGFVTLYQFWIHTKAIDRMPAWFEFIFNTPSHHRVHHAVDPKYIDKNHAAVFILWDRLFGTFMREEEEPTYGITSPLRSWNPTWANLHYFLEMFNIARHAKRLWEKVWVLVARPGWRPVEQGGYQAPPPVDKENYQKFDTEVPHNIQFYAIVQFMAVLFGLIAFMGNFERLSMFYRVAFLGIIILSIMICCALIENRRWVIAVEYLRLGLILASLNTLYYYWFIDWFTIMLLSSAALVGASVVYFTWSWPRWTGRRLA